MRFNLTYFTLLWAFFCTTEVFGKVKLLETDIRHITKLGNYKVRQERCMFLTRYGPCKKKIVVYGYNIVTNRCSEFLYSGCGGNPNRFTTVSHCRNTCYVVPVRKPVSEPDYYADDDVTEPMPEDEPYDY